MGGEGGGVRLPGRPGLGAYCRGKRVERRWTADGATGGDAAVCDFAVKNACECVFPGSKLRALLTLGSGCEAKIHERRAFGRRWFVPAVDLGFRLRSQLWRPQG